MTRRILRTLIQLSAAAIFTALVVLFLDRNYRVLPNSIHGYMPQHHPGLLLTDVTITTCSTVNPFSSCELDLQRWHRIDKELYLDRAWTSKAYMWLSRKREEDLNSDDRVVVDIRVGRLNPASQSDTTDEWESRPGGIWIRRSSKKQAGDSESTITDIDVLFGDDAVEARDNWAITGTPLLLDTGRNLHSIHLTARRGSHHNPKKPKVRIPESGKFKIMQLADLHLSTGVGKCRDAIPNSYNGGECEADPRTLEFVNKMLDEEKPDFVVLSGDQVNGETAPDAPSAMFKIAHVLSERKLPYAAIFGNHDDEGTMSRARQMALMESLPYSLSLAGPTSVDGVGNYYIEVLGRGSTEHSALTIYFLDTHSYSPDERNFPGYDWVKPSQIDWFSKTAESLQHRHAEYSLKHMDIAFIHIPMTEYGDWELPRVGEWREGVTAPLYNSGLRDAFVKNGIVMVSAGHDHCNDYCSLSHEPDADPAGKPPPAADDPDHKEPQHPALWMCYAGGVGLGGYAGYEGFSRRIRMFEVDAQSSRITTWKRVEWSANPEDLARRVDELVIIEGGRPQGPPQEYQPPPVADEAAEKAQQQAQIQQQMQEQGQIPQQ